MKAMYRALMVGLALTVAAAAQEYKGHGYVYTSVDKPSPGNFADLMSVGGGGEGLVWKGLTVGGDIGYLFPRVSAQSGVGMLSLDGGWTFVDRQKPGRIVPFLMAGYTLAFRSGTANLMNLGGGVAWWFTHHLALRTEVRTYVYTQGGGAFDTALRIGLQFR